MSCDPNNTVFAWAGDNTLVEVDFYKDRARTVPRVFASGATVNWRIVNEAGDTLVDSFAGAVDSSVSYRLTGNITNGAPAAGTYSLYAEVTESGSTEILPDPGSPPLTLSVSADPVP